jgi:hypothetical protein
MTASQSGATSNITAPRSARFRAGTPQRGIPTRQGHCGRLLDFDFTNVNVIASDESRHYFRRRSG